MILLLIRNFIRPPVRRSVRAGCGPFKESDIPSHSSVSRRFPVVQHGKARPIGDLVASRINMATATAEAISGHNCDVVVGLL